HAALGDVLAVLTGPRTSVRLVLTPEAASLARAARARTALALHDHRVEAVIANRVVPDLGIGGDAWRSGWVRAQAGHLARARTAFAPAPVLVVPHTGAEPAGPDALAGLASSLHGPP